MKKIIKILTVVTIIAVLSTFVVGCKKQTDDDVNRDEMALGNYGQKYVGALGFTKTNIDSAIICNGALVGTTTELEAALHLYSVAQANVMDADKVSSFSYGGGTATTGPVGGGLSFGDIMVKDNNDVYIQNVARISSVEGLPDTAIGIVQNMLDQSTRKFYDSSEDTYYVQKIEGSDATCRMIEDYPFGSSSFENGTLKTLTWERYKEIEYVRNSINDLTNTLISEDTIKNTEDDDIVIDYDSETGLYTLSFGLKLATQEEKDLATGEYARPDMQEASGTAGQEEGALEYNKYDMVIEIYDNGLPKSFTASESWDATLYVKVVFTMELAGYSLSSNTTVYSFDPEDTGFAKLEELAGITMDWIEG